MRELMLKEGEVLMVNSMKVTADGKTRTLIPEQRVSPWYSVILSDLEVLLRPTAFFLIVLLTVIASYPPAVSAFNPTEILPEDIEQHFKFGHEFYMMKNFDRALVEFENIKLMAPDSLLGYLWTGKTFARMNDFDRAVIDLNRGLALDPENAEIKELLERYGPMASISAEPAKLEEIDPALIISRIADKGKTRGIEYERIKAESTDSEGPAEIVLPGMGDEDGGNMDKLSELLGDTSMGNGIQEGDAAGAITERTAAKAGGQGDRPVGDQDAEEVCKGLVKKIKDAIFSFNLDHLEEMNEETFSIEKLVSSGYLKGLPECPSKGSYVFRKGDVICNYHSDTEYYGGN